MLECLTNADCDEGFCGSNECVECVEDENCEYGKYCTGVETCDANMCVAGTVVDCGEGVCDEEGDQCVECLETADCTSGFCVDNECVECVDNTHCNDFLFCTGKETCEDGECVAGTPVFCPEGICDEDYKGCIMRCGDGTLDPGEECDDNGKVDGDGCSAYCRIETPENLEVTIESQDNGDGTFNYAITDGGTGDGIITIENNAAPLDLRNFYYSYDGNAADGTVGIEITGLSLNGTTKDVLLPLTDHYCAVDSDTFSVGSFTWSACAEDDARIIWNAGVNPCGEAGSPVMGQDKDGNDLSRIQLRDP